MPCPVIERRYDLQRMLGYMIAGLASAVGWWLGSLLGPGAAFFASVIFVGVGLYLARRWLREMLG